MQSGQILGWVEEFKALSDIYGIADGVFRGLNPGLREKIALISKDCYGAGWLYMVEGSPDP